MRGFYKSPGIEPGAEYEPALPLVATQSKHGLMNANILMNHDYAPDDLVLTLNGEVVSSHFYNNSVSVIVDYTPPDEAGFYHYKIMSKEGNYVTDMYCLTVLVPTYYSYNEGTNSGWVEQPTNQPNLSFPKLNDLRGYTNIQLKGADINNKDFFEYIYDFCGVNNIEKDWGSLKEQKDELYVSSNNGNEESDFVNYYNGHVHTLMPWYIQATKEDGTIVNLYQGGFTFN